MRHKKAKKIWNLDYTTAIITITVCLLLFSVLLSSIMQFRKKFEEAHDADNPLAMTNIPYCNGEKLDLFVPESDKPVPLLIYIHGGGWQYGSKVGGSFEMVKPLVNKGFAVASINYRLSGRIQFPAQVQDVACSVRYLKSKAEQYNIDKDRVGLIGISAGAHLAVLASASSDHSAFTSSDYKSESSRVKAVVGINGLYDLNANYFNKSTKTNITKLTGQSGALATLASPLSYVSADDPPELLIYSQQDKQVPPTQTLNYAATARSAGINVETLKVTHADHNLRPYFNLSTDPNKQAIFNSIESFFERKLQN